MKEIKGKSVPIKDFGFKHEVNEYHQQLLITSPGGR